MGSHRPPRGSARCARSVKFAMVASLRCRLRCSLAHYASALLSPTANAPLGHRFSSAPPADLPVALPGPPAHSSRWSCSALPLAMLPARGCRPFSAENSPPGCFPGAPNPTGLPLHFRLRRMPHWGTVQLQPPGGKSVRKNCSANPQFAIVAQDTAVPCTPLLIGTPPRFRLRRTAHRADARLRPPVTYTPLLRILIRGSSP